MNEMVRTAVVVVAEGRRRVGGAHVLERRGEAGEGEGEAEAGAGGAAERGAAADEVLDVELQLRAPGLADVGPVVAAADRRGAPLPPEAGLARQAGGVRRHAQHRLRRRRPAQRLQRRQLLRLGPPDPSSSAAAGTGARGGVHRRLLHYRLHRT